MSDAPPVGKKRRWPFWLLGGVVVIMLAFGLILPRLVDVERFRPQIETVLRDSTGWEAELGDIELSLFRGALGVSPASLTAPGGDTSKIEIERIDVRAALLPLLRKQLRVESIRLVRPEIRLVRPDGATGWVIPVAEAAGAGARDRPAGKKPTDPRKEDTDRATAASGEAGGKARRFAVVVEEIGVRDGSLMIEDRAVTPAIRFDMTDVTSSFFPADSGLTGRLTLGEDDGRASWRGQVGRTIEITLEGLKTEVLQAFLGPDLIHGGGSFSGEITLGFPLRIEGNLVGKGLTLVSGERPFDRAGLELVIAPDGLGWQLEKLEFDGDGARVFGGGSLAPAIALRLELPDTPLETALRASESVLPLPVEVVAPGNLNATIRVDQPDGGELTYEASGHFSAAEVRPGALLPAAKDVQATFALDRAGRLQLDVTKSTIAGGPARGRAVIEQVYPPGKLRFSGGLQDAVFGQLMGGLVAEAKPVTGPTGFEASLGVDLARGTLDARALSGKLDFNARSLAMPGWDLDSAVRAKLVKSGKSGGAGLVSGLLGKDAAKNEASAEQVVDQVQQLIDSLEGTINFDRWPWGLEDIRLGVGDVASTGSGTFDPEQGTVAFTLTSQLSAEESAELTARYELLKVLRDRSGRLTLPVTVRGSMMAPSIKVDIDDALKGNLLGDEVKKDEVKGLLRGLLDGKKKD